MSKYQKKENFIIISHPWLKSVYDIPVNLICSLIEELIDDKSTRILISSMYMVSIKDGVVSHLRLFPMLHISKELKEF